MLSYKFSVSLHVPLLFCVRFVALYLFYYRYIQAAKEWALWVNCSPSERYQFYKDTIHDPDKAEEIDKELRKINCFNCILVTIKQCN